MILKKPIYFIGEYMIIEGNALFNDALNTFYLWLYGVRHMVKDHSDSERGNPLPPHRLLFPNSSKGSFIFIIPLNDILFQNIVIPNMHKIFWQPLSSLYFCQIN